VPFCLSRPFRPQVPLCPARTVGEVGSSIRGPYRAPVTWRTRAGTKRKDAPNAIMPSLNYLVRVSLFIEYRGRLYFCSSLRAAVRGKRVSPRRRGGGAQERRTGTARFHPPPSLFVPPLAVFRHGAGLRRGGHVPCPPLPLLPRCIFRFRKRESSEFRHRAEQHARLRDATPFRARLINSRNCGNSLFKRRRIEIANCRPLRAPAPESRCVARTCRSGEPRSAWRTSLRHDIRCALDRINRRAQPAQPYN